MTRKFNCYYEYKRLHARLFDVSEPTECAEVAGKLMDAYFENRQIYEELEYYKASGSVLGKHPIFRGFQRSAEIHRMSIKELVKEQRNVEYNIWRVRKQIEKNDKPHLDTERRTKLKQYEDDLALINKLLE